MNTTPPPIPWEDTFWDWQAIDADGVVGIYQDKPVKGLTMWIPVSTWIRMRVAEEPRDFTKCLWQRPQNEKQ